MKFNFSPSFFMKSFLSRSLLVLCLCSLATLAQTYTYTSYYSPSGSTEGAPTYGTSSTTSIPYYSISTPNTFTYTSSPGFTQTLNNTTGTYYFINNYSNYSCGIGYYKYNSRCYTCLGMPSNATYSTINSCTWTCNSGYYRNGNTCVANTTYPPYNYGTPGQCGTTLNSCAS